MSNQSLHDAAGEGDIEIGMFVVPTCKWLSESRMPGTAYPKPIPSAIAANIHTVR